MEKLKRTAKGLDIVCRIMFWLILIATVILFMGLYNVAITGKDNFLSSSLGDNFKIYQMFDYKIPLENIKEFNLKSFTMVTYAIAISTFGIIIYGIKIIRSMLKPMKEGAPFDDKVANGFNKLAWFTIIEGVVENVFNLILKNAITNLMIDAGAQTTTKLESSFNLMFILIAFLFFLFSYVFEYGEKLQQLSDETL